MTRTPAAGSARRTLRSVVLLFSLLCLGWVLWPIVRHSRELAATVEAGRLARWTVFGAVAYAALSGFLALAWWWLVGLYGNRPGPRVGYTIFARSQLAKYLPGNAFHYVSRQVLGRQAGLHHAALVASGFLELGSLLAASAMVALAATGRVALPGNAAPAWISAAVGAMIFLLGWPIVDAVLRKLQRTAGWLSGLPHLGLAQTLRLLGPSLLCHFVFFVGTGFLLVLLVGAAAPAATSVATWRILGAYALAWMAGTVALGAPAGVGVREAVLTWQLGMVLEPPQAAAAALALRLVTLGGDLLTASAGWWLQRRWGP